MGKTIPQAVKEVFATQMQWHIATFGKTPNVVPMTFKAFTPEEELVFADVWMKETKENVLASGQAAVAAHNMETREGYQIKGKARYETTGPLFEQMAMVVRTKNNREIKGIVILTPEEIIVTTPGPQNKERL